MTGYQQLEDNTPSERSTASPGYRGSRRDGLVTPSDRGSNGGYETGESSRAARQRLDLPVDDDVEDEDEAFLSLGSSAETEKQQQQQQQHYSQHKPLEERAQRKHKHRMSGGFLLRNPLQGVRSYGFRRQRGSQSTGQAQSNGGHDAFSTDRGRRQSSASNLSSLGDGESSATVSAQDGDARRFSDSQARQEQSSMDSDSSQIVLMALNLSESRRLAARRPSARATPPRLAPLPDASSSSQLKQHLQQQRRSSRSGGTRPFPESSSTLSSGSGVGAPFQPASDQSHDGQYTYQFSSSTLARAQKAKEHLELLAQYRRLLEVLPPLKPGLHMPVQVAPVTLGRQYNPLQYVRNRKVRARERQTIDGERQGFGDVECVKSWVDSVLSQMSLAGTSLLQGKESIPVFPGAEETYKQEPSEPLARTVSRARRPRADWFVEPCDMIADTYWLETTGHKTLIEDRQWRKIFPAPAAEGHHRVSGEVDDFGGRGSPLSAISKTQVEGMQDEGESGLARMRADHPHGSAKERAKLKLQTIREGFHSRHGAPASHDILGLRRGSLSDGSSVEWELGGHDMTRRSRPGRKGTITSHSNDLLQKQMLEMLEKEAKEQELESLMESPQRQPLTTKPPGRFDSRQGSLAEHSDSDLHAAPARAGLYANNASASSVGNYSSGPNSPDLPPVRPGAIKRTISLDPASPLAWSRSGSPVRKPFDKIKRIIRDKSGDSGEEMEEDRQPQPSPAGKQLLPVPGLESSSISKFQRASSKRLRSDETVGLRSMFKGPRIDTVIRDGVYRLGDKLGDKIWKRDPLSESPDVTTDESDNDRVKEGIWMEPKHFLEAMPRFEHVAGSLSRHPSNYSQQQQQQPQLIKSPSPRFDESEPEGSVTEGVGDANTCVLTIRAGGRPLNRHWCAADGEAGLLRLSKREAARMKALMLSSGIKAMEMHRRAHERQHLKDQEDEPVALVEAYPLAAQTLNAAVQSHSQEWQLSAGRFTSKTGVELRRRTWEVRTRLTEELSEMTRKAADEADETSRDLNLGQPLMIKTVVDTMEKMLRTRRRRFRWIRRGMWLTVEWLLVGIMWYVWFMVVILRVVVGVGRGALGCVRWLLWM